METRNFLDLMSPDFHLSCWTQEGVLKHWTSEEIRTLVLDRIKNLQNREDSIFALARSRTIDFVIDYIALLTLGKSIFILDAKDIQENSKKLEIIPHGTLVAGLGETTFRIANSTANHLPNSKESLVVFYSSGSTGSPKGVCLPLQSLLTNASELISIHRLNQRKLKILTPLPMNHVNACNFSFLCSYLSGQRLILFDQYDFLTLLHVLKLEKPEILSIIPPILKNIVDSRRSLKSYDEKLEYVVTAATYLPREVAKKFLETNDTKLIQGYGLSESTNFSCLMDPYLPRDVLDSWLISYDKPSVGEALPSHDVHFNSQISNDPGEIFIRSNCLMLGYLTKEEFLPIPGYVRTGDRGRFEICPQTQKKIFFIDSRIKDLIRLQGVNVSLSDVDLELMKYFGNIDVISVPIFDPKEGELAVCLAQTELSCSELDLLLQKFSDTDLAQMKTRWFFKTEKPIRTQSGKPLRHQWVNSIQKAIQSGPLQAFRFHEVSL